MASTNRKRLARALQAAIPDFSYQKALRVAEEALATKHGDSLKEASRITVEASTDVPAAFSANWDRIPLGIRVDTGEAYYWEPEIAANLLVGGMSGRGKTVFLQTVLQHVNRWSDQWQAFAFDPKESEFFTTTDSPIVSSHTDTLLLLEQVEAEMHRRYSQMAQNSVNHYSDLSESTPAIMVLIDEVWALFYKEDAFSAEVGRVLGRITRLGRAAGVQVVLSSQRPEYIPDLVRANFDASVGLGPLKPAIIEALRLDVDPTVVSRMMMSALGRGVAQSGAASATEVQCYMP